MTPQPVTVRGVEVTVRAEPRAVARLERSGFHDRYGTGLGRQFDRRDIEGTRASQPTDVLRRLPGIRLIPSRSGDYIPINKRGGGLSEANCPLAIFLDGVRWQGDVDDVPIEWIEGLEVYLSPAEVPAQYSGTAVSMPGSPASCGVVLIWTR